MKKIWGIFLLPGLFISGCSQTSTYTEPAAKDETVLACIDYRSAMDRFSEKADNPEREDLVNLNDAVFALIDYDTESELTSLLSQFAIYTAAYAKWDPPMTTAEQQEMIKLKTQLDDYCSALAE